MKKFGNSQKIIILSVVIVAASLLITNAFLENESENQDYSYDGPPRAAIIDQLYDDIPNVYFHDKASELLETAGYEVEIFTTEQLTVDFYKKIPTMNYELIVFRTHAIGNNGTDDTEKNNVSIFTGEKYRDNKYISEQLAGQIGKGAPYRTSAIDVSVNLTEMFSSNQTSFEVVTPWEIVDDSNPYFLIGAKYVNEIMEGKFPNSLIILGGCSTLYNPTLANALIDRGASSVIGWDNLVGSSNNDQSMLAFLENHLIDDMEIKDAIDAAMSKYGKSTKYEVTLSFLSSD